MANNGRALRKISHARILLAHVLREVEKGGDCGEDLERAKVLIYGTKCLGELIKNADLEAELAQMRKELVELKRGQLKVA